MKLATKLSPIVLSGAFLMSAVTSHAEMLLTLTGDLGQTTPDLVNPTATSLANTTNDPFAYNILSPTSPSPVQNYYAGQLGYHGSNQPSVTIAYTFGTVVGGDIIFDLYGRAELGGAELRDNGMVLRLYNGDWVTPVFTSAPFDIPDGAPFHTRYTTPTGLFSDRVSLTGTNYFTLMEIRASIPEPSTVLLAILGGAFLRRRRN